jgi:hypothetical protein
MLPVDSSPERQALTNQLTALISPLVCVLLVAGLWMLR